METSAFMLDTQPQSYATAQNAKYSNTKSNFVDMKDINNHILVHSTAIGELRNDNWYNEFANTDSNNAAGTNTGVPR